MSTLVSMTVETDEFKLYQVLEKFSQQYEASYTVVRNNDLFILKVKTDNFSELIRRLGIIKDCKIQIQEIVGSPSVKKAKIDWTPTNVDALIGKETFAQTEIKPIEGGLIKLIGEQWFSRPLYDKTILRGSRVKVVKVEGVSLIVEEVEEEKNE